MTLIAVVLVGIFFFIFALALVPAMVAAAIEEKWKLGTRTMLLGYDSESFQTLVRGPSPKVVDVSGLALWPNRNQVSPGFVASISRGFVGWQDYKGRSTRSEFWWWYLFRVIVSLAIIGVAILFQWVFGSNNEVPLVAMFLGVLSLLFEVATFLPTVALSIRRLHDTDRSGWWLLIALLPVLGVIALVVFFVLPSTIGVNRYGAAQFNSRSDEVASKVKVT